MEMKPEQDHSFTIRKGHPSDADEIFGIYRNAKSELERRGLYQWTDHYPTLSIIKNDLDEGVLYKLCIEDEIIGAINISEKQEEAYASVPWQFDDSKVLVIHRLVVDPKYQRQGFAQRLMDFAESFAVENGYSSIRLDAYSQNTAVINFYKKRDYFIRGDIRFSGREYPFHCMEKEVNQKPFLRK